MKIHETVRIAAVMSVVILALAVSKASYSQDGTEWLEYSTRGDPKAAGHDFTLRYTPGYVKANEFSRAEFLQVFVPNEEAPGGSGVDSYYYMTAGIQDMPEGVTPSSFKTEGYWDLERLERFWDVIAGKMQGVTAVAKAVGFGGLPMARISSVELKGELAYLKATLLVLHGEKNVKLECGMNILVLDQEFSGEDFAKYPGCASYFSSLTFAELP
jgi:hypothetical protein